MAAGSPIVDRDRWSFVLAPIAPRTGPGPLISEVCRTAGGSPTRSESRRLREVLVYETAEYVTTIDGERRGSDDRVVARHRHAEIQSPVRPLLVVVPDIFLQNPCQVTAAEDEDPVEALCPHCLNHCLNPALRVGIGSRRTNGGLDDPDTLRAKHLVEAVREFRIPVSDQELE